MQKGKTWTHFMSYVDFVIVSMIACSSLAESNARYIETFSVWILCHVSSGLEMQVVIRTLAKCTPHLLFLISTVAWPRAVWVFPQDIASSHSTPPWHLTAHISPLTPPPLRHTPCQICEGLLIDESSSGDDDQLLNYLTQPRTMKGLRSGLGANRWSY